MTLKEAVKIMYPDKYDEWWKGIDKDKDYQEKADKLLEEKRQLVEMDPDLVKRSVNEGFSGGEKKRNEVLQLALLNPELALLDETDSGLDIDALRIVSEGVNRFKNSENAVLLVTHYQRILEYIKTDYVHVLVDGKIVRSGGSELAFELEEKGYEWIRESMGTEVGE